MQCSLIYHIWIGFGNIERKRSKWAISMHWTLMEFSVIPVKRQLSLLSRFLLAHLVYSTIWLPIKWKKTTEKCT